MLKIVLKTKLSFNNSIGNILKFFQIVPHGPLYGGLAPLVQFYKLCTENI
jgi:hypothetical protein